MFRLIAFTLSCSLFVGYVGERNGDIVADTTYSQAFIFDSFDKAKAARDILFDMFGKRYIITIGKPTRED